MFSEEQQKEEEEEEEEPLAGKDEEERRIAEMGRPMLGDHVKLEVIIEESYEFKVRQGVCLCGQINESHRSDWRLINPAEMAGADVIMCLIHALSEHRHVCVRFS